MFRDRFLTILKGGAAAIESPVPPRPVVAERPATKVDVRTRASHGLEQFFTAIRDREALTILDLTPASQANVSFITELGHRIYTEDLIQMLDDAFGRSGFYENQADPQRTRAFLADSLDFPEGHFDGALVWDTLQYITPPLLELVVERLARILKPGASALSFFHADEKARLIPVHSYRIADSRTLLLVPRGERQPAQYFNNRGLEKLFQRFESVKFFLTRDHLREVIVKR